MNELLQKLEELTKKDAGIWRLAKNSNPYRMIREAIVSGSGFIRPNYTSGRGRFTRVSDNEALVRRYLDMMGISYSTGNDAARGGKSGVFIIFNDYKHA
jgi:hypothetical protein